MWNLWWILIPLFIGLGLFLIIWFLTKNKKKDGYTEEGGWNCIEEGCEYDMTGGSYRTQKECQDSCEEKKRKMSKEEVNINKDMNKDKHVHFQEGHIVAE
jgi:hypothetical protein